MITKIYRNIYVEVDVVATGDNKYPIYICEDVIINGVPKIVNSADLVVKGTLYTNNVIFGRKYTRKHIKELLINL